MAESARQQRMRELGLTGETTPSQSESPQPAASGMSARQKRMIQLGIIQQPTVDMEPDAADSQFRQEAQSTPTLQPQLEPQTDPGAGDSAFRNEQTPISKVQAERENASKWFDDSALGRGIRDYVFEPFAQAIDNTPKLFGLPVNETRKATDAFGQAAGSFYVPGAGASNVAGLSNAVNTGISRLAPGLEATLGGRILQGVNRELITGAPIGAGQVLAQGGQLDDAAQGALYGAAGGGIFGAAGPLIGRAASSLAERFPGSKLADVVNPTADPLALPYKPYEDLSLTSRADSATTRSPGQGFRTNDPAMVDNFNRSEAYNSPQTQANRADSVLEQYTQSMQQKYDPQNLGEDVWAKMNRNEKTQMAQYRASVTPPETAPTGEIQPTLNAPSSTADQIKGAFGAMGQGMKESGDAQRAKLLAENGFLEYKNPAAADLFETQNPGFTRTFEDGKHRFYPPSETSTRLSVRGNYQNQLNNGNHSEALQNKIRNTDNTYERFTDVQGVNKANENVKDLTKAESDFLLNQSGGKEHIITGQRIMQKLDALGEHDRALVIYKKLAEDLTTSGQTTQAASLIAKLSPEGQLLNLVRTAERNGKEVSVADSVKFKELAAKVQEKSGAGIRANQFNEILNRMEKGENVGADEIKKLSDYLSGAEKVTPARQLKHVIEPNDTNATYGQSATFTTSKGSTYTVDANGNTTRNKTLHQGHSASDVGLKETSEATFYVDKAEAPRIGSHFGMNKDAKPQVVFRDDGIYLFSWNAKEGRWGIHGKPIPYTKTPEVGKSPIEMWKISEDPVLGKKASKVHAGNEITELNGSKPNSKVTVKDDLPAEFKDVRKRDRIVSYLDDVEQAALARIAARKNNLNSLPLPEWKDHAIVVASQIAKGTIKAATHVEDLVKMFGEEIRPVATQVFQSAQKLITGVSQSASEGNLQKANEAFKRISGQARETNLQEKIVEKYIKENPKVSPKDIDTLRELAKNVTRLSGDQRLDADIAMQKILNSYEKSSLWDKTLAIRYMNMLLNTSTQAINAVSGPIMATTGHVSDILGTMVDIVMSKALKQPRTTTLYGTNPLQFMARYFKNLKTGAKAGAMGVNPAGIQGTNEIRGLAFKSLYNPLGLAERALGAVAKGPDFATYKSVFDSEMIKQGFLDAKNNGIKGRQNIKNHIEQFINEPTEAAILQADRIGKNTTFQRSDTMGGKLANFLNNSPNVVKPVVNAVFPFVRTPVNIASTAVTMTPAGVIKGLYQLTSKSDASRREAIRTLSMGVTGSGIGAVGYFLSQIGVITGANDSGDKEVDAIREQAGKGKYRFNTTGLMRYLESLFNGEGPEAAAKAAQYKKGDEQFDYNKLQPLAFPLAIGAGLQNNKDKPFIDQSLKAGEDAYGSLFGMSTLKGVQDVFQPQFGGSLGEKALGVPSRLAESFFKSFSPGGPAQEARRQDPIVRKVPFNDGLIPDTKAYFQSRTPGLSQSLPPSKTTLGQNKLNAPGFTGSYLNPYKSEVAPYNEAAAVISKLIDKTGDNTLAPSAPDKKVEGVKVGSGLQGKRESITLTPERYAKLQEDVGQGIIKAILALPDNLSDEKKAAKIKDIYSTVKEKERNKVKRENGIRIN